MKNVIWVGDKSNEDKRLCGYKVKYPGRICYTLSAYAHDDGDGGLVFDFSEEQMPFVKELLQKLDDAEPEIYPEEELKKFDEWEKENEKKEKTLRYRLYRLIEDIGIQITPFDWGFKMSMKKIIDDNKGELLYKMCDGIKIGPIMFTW